MGKGFFTMSFYDVIAIILLLLVLPFELMILKAAPDKSYAVREKIQYLEDDDNFIAILRTPYGDKIMLDLIFENDEKLNEYMNGALEPAFGKVCWELKLDGKSIAKEKCKKIQKDEILKSAIDVPYMSEAVKLELVVPGYRE
ncbi:MAG: hypothetical protein NDI94_02160 [Candidatus Woesearchaeota archaeon]|nr:hypothetical protein [Candidatus Woesearchaeota archaeon]